MPQRQISCCRSFSRMLPRISLHPAISRCRSSRRELLRHRTKLLRSLECACQPNRLRRWLPRNHMEGPARSAFLPLRFTTRRLTRCSGLRLPACPLRLRSRDLPRTRRRYPGLCRGLRYLLRLRCRRGRGLRLTDRVARRTRQARPHQSSGNHRRPNFIPDGHHYFLISPTHISTLSCRAIARLHQSAPNHH